MKNEFFGLSQRWGLKSGLFENSAKFKKALKSGLFVNLANFKALKSKLFQVGFKQSLAQSPKTQATQARQGDFSLSLSLSLV